MAQLRIPPAHSLAPAAVTHDVRSDRVLQACGVAGMVGVLHQLGLLAEQAHEIFEGLTVEATRSAQRVGGLQERLRAATERLADVDDTLSAATQDEISRFCSARPGVAFQPAAEEQSALFTAASRPPSVQAAFDRARPPPRLDLLDPFVPAPPGGGKYAKYDLLDTCADGYSDAHFFLKQWLDEEERKLNDLKAVRGCAARRKACHGAARVRANPHRSRCVCAPIFFSGAQGASRRASQAERRREDRGGRASQGEAGGQEAIPDGGGEARAQTARVRPRAYRRQCAFSRGA